MNSIAIGMTKLNILHVIEVSKFSAEKIMRVKETI